MSDPFAILGLRPSSTPAEIRRAFRKLALEHHPDRNADAGAEERFKRIVRAYRAAMFGERGGARRAAKPAGPRPDRYACGACGDTFPFPERCPRCEVELVDGIAPAVTDARVDAFMSELEGRPIVDGKPWGEQLPLPGLMAALFLGAA